MAVPAALFKPLPEAFYIEGKETEPYGAELCLLPS